MYKEYFILGQSDSLDAGDGTVFQQFTTKVDSDADFEFDKTTYVATNDRIKLKYKDDSVGRYLSKNAMDIKAVGGRNTLAMGDSNSFIPFIWPRPYVISAGTTFSVEAADYSGIANSLYMGFHGAKIRVGKAPWDSRYYQFRAVVPFVYNFTGGAITVAASGTAIGSIEIDVDAHFLVQKVTGIRTGDALVLVSEAARGRDWSSGSIHIDNLIGNGSFPNILPANRMIPKGSSVVINLTNLLDIPNIIDINLIGIKLYV